MLAPVKEPRSDVASTPPAPDAAPVADTDVSAAPPAGGRVFGRYRLLEQLGSGGMGVVWCAWDPQLQRMVALKQVHEHVLQDREARERFEREARLAARLHHAAIVAVHDVGEVAGQPYLTMERIDGTPLGRLLDPGRAALRAGEPRALADLRRWVALLADVADAVACAHAQGVIHRDLKPANILVDRAGRPFVMDFGLAKDIQSGPSAASEGRARDLTVSGQFIGTPLYMSPEQARGESHRVGPEADLRALGVILYELLCGVTPFEGGGVGPWEVLKRIEHSEPRRPTLCNPHVPRELEAVCLKALEKDVQRRYPGASAFERELRRWLRGEPVEARAPGVLERARRGLSRHRRATVVAAVLIGLGFATIGYRMEVEQERRTVTGLQRRTLEQLRWIARLCVGEALAGRRQGDLAPGRRLRTELARAVDAAEQELGGRSPEPPYHLGRLLRVLAEDAAAAAAQEHALALDPQYVPALYERALLAVRACELLQARVQRQMALRLAVATASPAADGVSAGFAPLDPADPGASVGIAAVEHAQRAADGWLQRLRAGLAANESAPDVEAPWLRVTAEQADALETMFATLAGKLSWEQARARLERAIAVDATREELHESLVGAALRAGQWQAAIDVGTQGLSLDRGDAALWRGRAMARLRLGWRREGQGEDPSAEYAGALQDCSQAIALAGEPGPQRIDRSLIHLTLARRAARLGDDVQPSLASALADAESAIAVEPEDPAAWLQTSQVHFDLAVTRGRSGADPESAFRAALAALDQVVRLAPEQAEVWSLRGLVRAQRARANAGAGSEAAEELARALADLEQALTLAPNSVPAWTRKGLVRFQIASLARARGEDPAPALAAALADYEAALQRSPGDSAATVGLAQVHTWLGTVARARRTDVEPHFRAAVDAWTEAIQVRPGASRHYQGRATSLLGWGAWDVESGRDPEPRYLAAQADYDAALRLEPANQEALRGRGYLALCRGHLDRDRGIDPEPRWQAAAADLLAAAERNPGDPQTACFLGELERWRAEHAQPSGVDPFPGFERSLTWYAKAQQTREPPAMAWSGAGDVYYRRAFLRLEQGADPAEDVAAALAAYDASLARDAEQPTVRERVAKLRAALGRDAALAAWEDSLAAAVQAVNDGRYQDGRAPLEAALRARPDPTAPLDAATRTNLQVAHYSLACCLAQLSAGQSTRDGAPAPVATEDATMLRAEAFRHLRTAMELGYDHPDETAADPDLVPLHIDQAWLALLRSLGR